MISGKKKKYRLDLIDHMAECDVNYMRLMKLFSDMADRDHQEIGIRTDPAHSTRITIGVVERFKYTTTLAIHVAGRDSTAIIRWPSIQVRLYHDLRTAEVTSYEEHRQFEPRYEYPNQRMYHPNEKVQLNRFLGELLSHCLENGHSVKPLMAWAGGF